MLKTKGGEKGSERFAGLGCGAYESSKFWLGMLNALKTEGLWMLKVPNCLFFSSFSLQITLLDILSFPGLL